MHWIKKIKMKNRKKLFNRHYEKKVIDKTDSSSKSQQDLLKEEIEKEPKE
jgi:hypothetical protein